LGGEVVGAGAAVVLVGGGVEGGGVEGGADDGG
jgi:hypothetical protein